MKRSCERGVAPKSKVLPVKHTEMGTKTKQEVMAKLTQKYVGDGAEYRVKLIGQVVELTGGHRKSAIRALNKKPWPKKERAPGIKTGRPLAPESAGRDACATFPPAPLTAADTNYPAAALRSRLRG